MDGVADSQDDEVEVLDTTEIKKKQRVVAILSSRKIKCNLADKLALLTKIAKDNGKTTLTREYRNQVPVEDFFLSIKNLTSNPSANFLKRNWGNDSVCQKLYDFHIIVERDGAASKTRKDPELLRSFKELMQEAVSIYMKEESEVPALSKRKVEKLSQKGVVNPIQRDVVYDVSLLSTIVCPFCGGDDSDHKPKMQILNKEETDAINQQFATQFDQEMAKYKRLSEAQKKKQKRPKKQSKPYTLVCLCAGQNCRNWQNGSGCYQCTGRFKAGLAKITDEKSQCSCRTCRCDCQGYLDSMASLHKVLTFVANQKENDDVEEPAAQSGKHVFTKFFRSNRLSKISWVTRLVLSQIASNRTS